MAVRLYINPVGRGNLRLFALESFTDIAFYWPRPTRREQELLDSLELLYGEKRYDEVVDKAYVPATEPHGCGEVCQAVAAEQGYRSARRMLLTDPSNIKVQDEADMLARYRRRTRLTLKEIADFEAE